MDTECLQVLNRAGGEENNPVELNIHDRIGDGGMLSSGLTSGAFKRALDSIPTSKHVRVSINSMGGDVAHGTAMYNALANRGDKVSTRVDGFAASMGAVVAMAGHRRTMMPGTMLVLHNPSNAVQGDEKVMQRNTEYLKQVKSNLVDIFASRSGQSAKAVAEMMDRVTSLSPRQAKELGFCTDIAAGTPANNCLLFGDQVLDHFRAVNEWSSLSPEARSAQIAALQSQLRASNDGAQNYRIVQQLRALRGHPLLILEPGGIMS